MGARLSLWRDERGLSAVELALILPILVMFSAGTIEYSRLILLTQKLQSAAFNLADLTARDKELTTDGLANVFLAIDQVVRPFDFAGSGRAIVTSVGVDEDEDAFVYWQCEGSGGFAVGSLVGSGAGNEAAVPEGLVGEGETLIVAEAFFDFEPLFGVGLAPQTLRRVAYYKPRLGELMDVDCPGA